MSEKEKQKYKCPRCGKELSEKVFGTSVGYFCPSDGLVRSEIYMPSYARSDVKQALKIEKAIAAKQAEDNAISNNTAEDTQPTAEETGEQNNEAVESIPVEPTEKKPVRRRKAKPSINDGDGANSGN